ncbi:MAG: STAS/SEC14 domain-containing protein [Wenzhouxiangellaceae bacterium]|nr:STAS/SEC14 domain-containing protein [Wenzhouxiangellaceae bacterium]
MKISYRTDYGILEVQPTGGLSEEDFENLASELDRIQDEGREFKGILIVTEEFPGYRKFADMLAHGEFIKEHRDRIPKIAICTDSPVAHLADLIGSTLTGAEVETYDHGERDDAEKWLLA